MSKIISVWNKDASPIGEYLDEQEKFGILTRDTNAVFTSINPFGKLRIRQKIKRNSKYFKDTITDTSFINGCISILLNAKKYNFALTMEQLLKYIKENNLEFHHIDGNTLNNEFNNLVLVTKEIHKEWDNLNWKIKKNKHSSYLILNDNDDVGEYPFVTLKDFGIYYSTTDNTINLGTDYLNDYHNKLKSGVITEMEYLKAICGNISHETNHWLLNKMINRETSAKYDFVASDIEDKKYQEITYKMGYVNKKKSDMAYHYGMYELAAKFEEKEKEELNNNINKYINEEMKRYKKILQPEKKVISEEEKLLRMKKQKLGRIYNNPKSALKMAKKYNLKVIKVEKIITHKTMNGDKLIRSYPVKVVMYKLIDGYKI